jgi:hypothetical protein
MTSVITNNSWSIRYLCIINELKELDLAGLIAIFIAVGSPVGTGVFRVTTEASETDNRDVVPIDAQELALAAVNFEANTPLFKTRVN